ARIFLLGAAPTVAAKAKVKLEKKYNCTIVGTDDGAATPDNYYNLRELINSAEPDILFVAFGAPKQEIWLARNLAHLKSVKVAIGVGGAFDFVSGAVKRAPHIFQKLGLEWLWRLFLQPSRIRRIYRATIKFPLTVIGASGKSGKHPN
ncbi:WecB/TagA/CpsF family glycosyltransferase, partial [Patescibacteria group bacterium]|nr:WecB/TagA/CpsF family glycosyltransferase [Patescibacteria group bacterium]MBU1703379.1 WecB/TagA/CpsF family glycosyltransferase [Patescibacteria group bacterium]